jgi:hypothetical protein
MPMQHGLVPNRPSAPPQGATIGRDNTLTKCSATSPVRHGHLCEVADAAQVVGCASVMMQLPCCRARSSRQFDRLLADHLAVAALAVQREQRADVGVHAGGRIGHQPALGTAST